MKHKVVYGLLSIFILVVVLNNLNCSPSTSNHSYLNHADSAHYVGKDVCGSCHLDKLETFLQTGMGLSFDSATVRKSSANFDTHHVLYDSTLDFYYHPFWSSDKLYLKEFRLSNNGDTMYSRTEEITYIIGSGQHTNSHLIAKGDYVVQAPFTWYDQEQRLDFPPGFERGQNSRFSRVIELECMSCHNALPTMVGNSNIAYASVGTGIDCERCHGPGSIHVKYHQSGTAQHQEVDYSIVNPKHLSLERQLDICQRCHLQGNNVLKPGKSFADFKPGMKLSDVFEVFLPQYANGERLFNMANHADRFQASACFKHTADQNKFSCITCHNPHVSVKTLSADYMVRKCLTCHQDKTCSESSVKRSEANDNCVTCHMPASNTADIPHVQVHDHKIGIHRNSVAKPKSSVIGLYSVNGDDTEAETWIKAYLTYYEKFDPNPVYLHIADSLLSEHKFPGLQVHYYFQTQQWNAVTRLIDRYDLTNGDAMTCYRIATAYSKQEKYNAADQWYGLAVLKDQSNFKFLTAQGINKSRIGAYEQAEELLVQSYKRFNEYQPTLSGLVFVYIRLNQYSKAQQYLEQAIQKDPDDLKTLENGVLLYSVTQNSVKERYWLQKLLVQYPDHKIAQKRLLSLQE